MPFASVLELIFAGLFSLMSLTNFFGSRFGSFNDMLERLPWDFLTPFGRKLVVRLLSAFFACVFWALYFFSYRVEPSSPNGFAELSFAVLGLAYFLRTNVALSVGIVPYVHTAVVLALAGYGVSLSGGDHLGGNYNTFLTRAGTWACSC